VSRKASRNRPGLVEFRDAFRDDHPVSNPAVPAAYSNTVRIGYARVSTAEQHAALQGPMS